MTIPGDIYYEERADREDVLLHDELLGWKEYAERLEVSYPQDVLARQARYWLNGKDPNFIR